MLLGPVIYLSVCLQTGEGDADATVSCIRVYKRGKLVDTARNGSTGAIQSLLAKHVLTK